MPHYFIENFATIFIEKDIDYCSKTLHLRCCRCPNDANALNNFLPSYYTNNNSLKFSPDMSRLCGLHTFYGVRKIALEENCPPVRVRVWFRISVRIRAGGQFSSRAIFLEPHFTVYKVFVIYTWLFKHKYFNLSNQRFLSRKFVFRALQKIFDGGCCEINWLTCSKAPP